MVDDDNNLNPLLPYQKQIEKELINSINKLGVKTKLRDACEYALLNGGKRFRPAIVFMISKALGFNADVTKAAIAVEYFHTASLIADDLPCMDNDDERRGKKSLHVVYGEACALLCSYVLISAGYECLTQNVEDFKGADAEKRGILSIQNASYNTGILGAAGGQYLDMYAENQSVDTLKEVILKKTISLFEISFVLGWLFGGGKIDELPNVKKAAAHFGMAFQIADDIEDLEQDLKNGHKVNVAVNFGKDKAFDIVKDEIASFFETMDVLKIDATEFKNVAKALLAQTQKHL